MEKWVICYRHTFLGDIIEGTFADAVRAGIAKVEEDFDGEPLEVCQGRGCPGIDYKEEVLTFNSPLDLIASIEHFNEN